MRSSIIIVATLAAFACSRPQPSAFTVSSPDGGLTVQFWLSPSGQAHYSATYGSKIAVDTSGMGFTFQNAPPLAEGLEVVEAKETTFDETWEMTWGEQRQVRNHYRELNVALREKEAPGRRFNVVFRVFDDGLGFRYAFPAQEGVDSLVFLSEDTEFTLGGDHTAWWQPGDWDIYEHIYSRNRVSEIDAIAKRNHPNLAQTYIPENAVNTPVTLRSDDGLYLCFHEAALYNYPSMTLRVDGPAHRFTSALAGRADGVKATVALPFNTPWRTVQVADRAGDLIESRLILNLNEPNQLKDVSWIRPMKYAGIWWEMHLDKSTWAMEGGRHGATTENAKAYIDFCAENNIQGLLVEGWNTGWERWIGFEDREGVFDFVTPYPDYDLTEVARYAQEKNVALIMHHETSSAVRTYDAQLDTAYALCEQLGIHAVKTGYVGKIIPGTEYHQGQWMVNHFQRVVETAARHKVMVDAHETIKDTGIRRTWPNFMSRETVRGQEFNAWSMEGGNPTDHPIMLAFTQMLAGPIDYTPGIVNLTLKPYKPNNRVKHTLAYELALYVVIYSPVQMAADLPEHYAGHPAMPFIREVVTDWEQTRVIDGEPGDFVAIARQERGGERWFLGAIANEAGKEMSVKLDFLPAGKRYELILYADGPEAHWDTNPTDMTVTRQEVAAGQTLNLRLAPGGGAAAVLKPL
jgi:alpha-glucosidase